VRAEPCGVTVIFGWRQKGCSAGSGSTSNTSSVAPAAVEQRDQVGLHQVRAARDVDQVAARLAAVEARQVLAIQDAARRFGQRQQVDQHAARAEEGIELRLAGKAAQALDGLGRAAPAIDRELELRDGLRDPLAEHAEAHHADREILAVARLAEGPPSCPRVGLVEVELAEMPDQRMADVLGHLHRHAGIVEPHHLGFGRQFQLEQRIDAGADVEDAAQLRLVVDEGLRRHPDHGVVGLRCAGAPVLHDGIRQCGTKALDPGVGAVVGEADGDSHACKLKP
jgi:hypothetical protein